MMIYLYSNIIEHDLVYPSNPVLSFYYKLYVKIANKYNFIKNKKIYDIAYNYNRFTFYHHFFYDNIDDKYVFLSANEETLYCQEFGYINLESFFIHVRKPHNIAEFTIKNTIIREKISDTFMSFEYCSENLKYCREVVMNKILESI